MKITSTKLVFCLALLVLGRVAVSAQEAPFQAALWAPDLQLVDAKSDIRGVRLQVYGENANVTGLDLGLANVTTGNFTGVSLGWLVIPALYNRVDGNTTGWQVGAVNITRGRVFAWQGGLVSWNQEDFTGLETSFFNWNEPATSDLLGVQIAFVNVSGAVEGVQLGFVNRATTLRGVQLGLWNEVTSRSYTEFSPLPRVFPFINIGF